MKKKKVQKDSSIKKQDYLRMNKQGARLTKAIIWLSTISSFDHLVIRPFDLSVMKPEG